MIATPEQEARSIREGLAIMLRAREERIALLEKLIGAYADQVIDHEGITYLEERFFNEPGLFTDEEWTEIRKIAKETG
jgi:hypothetical protein